MAGPIESIEGTILLREVTGEHFDHITVLSSSTGLVTFLHRRSRKSGSTGNLDLFDRIAATLERRDAGGLHFSREVRVLRRRSGLAEHYDGLREACRFARLLIANPVHDNSREAVGNLLEQALDAWERGEHAAIVAVKCLYVFARTEGYPVREDWRRQLSPDDRTTATRVLNQSTREIDQIPPKIETIRRDLELYLRHFTEIRIDPQ